MYGGHFSAWLSMPGDVSGLDEQTMAMVHHACYMAVCAARMTFVKKNTCHTLQVIQSPSNCRACGLQCSRCDCIVGDINEEEMHKRHWRTHLHKQKSIGELLSTNCAVLCCAVLCCAVLCCAVLCCAVLYQCSYCCPARLWQTVKHWKTRDADR